MRFALVLHGLSAGISKRGRSVNYETGAENIKRELLDKWRQYMSVILML